MTDILATAQSTKADKNSIDFKDLGLSTPILNTLKQVGYDTPTPIQQSAIPAALAGQDLLLSAQTGSGKTAAFVLPILERLIKANLSDKRTKPKVFAVILTPTRELAMQVQSSVRSYGSRLRGVFSVPLVGGLDYRGQIRALTKGVQIIVATPGRFLDHYQAGRIDLSVLEMLVLDEADRMLDMGFSEAINEIVAQMPSERQSILSSATWDGQVGQIAQKFTQDPKKISIAVESRHIDESVYFCDDFYHKNALLERILDNDEMGQAVIFAATKLSTERLSVHLVEKGHKAAYLHGDLPQGKRNRIVSDIKSGKTKFLIATDVAARGIDIAGISHVINYDLPRQAEDYVHRIGRSGRAGRTGVAVSLCSREDRHLLAAIDRYLGRKMRKETIEGLEPKIIEANKKHSKRQSTKTNHFNKKPSKPSHALGVHAKSKTAVEIAQKITKPKMKQPLEQTQNASKKSAKRTLTKTKKPTHQKSSTLRPKSATKPQVEEILFHQTAKRRFGNL